MITGMSCHAGEVEKMQNISSSIDGLMERHVSGVLPLPLDVMARAHLEMRSENRGYVRDLETLAGDSLSVIAPVDLQDRDSRIASIFNSAEPAINSQRSSRSTVVAQEAWMPEALREFVGDVSVPWRTRMPGFRQHNLGKIDGCEVELFWIKAGRAIPTHTHEGAELTLVLDGGFSDGEGHYVRGDISIADSNVNHRPVADDDGPCIGFAVTTDALRLTGRFHERIRDILGHG
jgi:putative transcriptional regulator